jgi:hypothetical protein
LFVEVYRQLIVRAAAAAAVEGQEEEAFVCHQSGLDKHAFVCERIVRSESSVICCDNVGCRDEVGWMGREYAVVCLLLQVVGEWSNSPGEDREVIGLLDNPVLES